MTSALRPLLFALLLLTACSTTEEKQPLYGPTAWSVANPLDIPYEIRRKQFEQGNLVPNPSFEKGRHLTADRAGAFHLADWEKVGPNVSWVDRDPDPETAAGSPPNRRCIVIKRDKVSEVDEAEGIISDYIPVMPGNYAFTYNIRLQDIVSHQFRRGVKLHDAIAVKVLFFDDSKQALDAAARNPLSGSLIDNSDKSYSFANFWRIDDFPWGTVRGRTDNYPFAEGDIPAQARYVRLFFGLRGSGTMWLDDVYFAYAKWNFTALERFKPYFGRRLTVAERLLPTPRHFQAQGPITYYRADAPPSHLPIIVLPANPAPAERLAAHILQRRIRRILDKRMAAQNRSRYPIRVLEGKVPLRAVANARLILSIGRSRIYRQVQPDLPLGAIQGREQGYVIQTAPSGDHQIVFLMGASPTGTYNAAATAVQLFEDDAFVFQAAAVVDYPDFLGRAYVLRDWQTEKELQNDLAAVERMSLYKLNKAYFGFSRKKKNWYQPGELYRQGLAQIGRLFEEGGVMHLAVMVNPYAHFPMEAAVEGLDDELRYTWTHSSPESLRTLKEVYQIGLAAGADTLMLLADDFIPHAGSNPQNYTLFTAEDKRRFVNLQNAQAHIINRLQEWLERDYPGTRLEFCPPWYSNEHIDRSEGRAEVYLRELALQIPQDVAIIWTGPTIRSLSIDMADLHRIRSLIGRWPMLWDNTLYARNIETTRYGGYTTYYPDKVTLCNLFEPYDAYLPQLLHRYSDRRQRYTNGRADSEVYQLKYATVADYLWNTTAYNPERSLWKVLVRSYGSDGAQKLIRFSDAYYRLYGTCRRMEIEGVNNDAIKNGRQYLTDLDHYLLSLTRMLPEAQTLLAELKAFRDKQKARLEKLTRETTGQDVQDK
jgi:hypothetical protein